MRAAASVAARIFLRPLIVEQALDVLPARHQHSPRNQGSKDRVPVAEVLPQPFFDGLQGFLNPTRCLHRRYASRRRDVGDAGSPDSVRKMRPSGCRRPPGADAPQEPAANFGF